MGNERCDVIVVGGGMGGLNLAALLAHVGKKVLVLERGGEEDLGGRAASGKIGSAAVDNGIKGLIMAGTQDEVHKRIGKPLPQNVCEWTNSGEIHANGEWHKLDEMIRRSLDELLKVYKRTSLGMTYEQIEDLDDISIEQFVARTTDNQDVIDFFRYLGWLFGGTLPAAWDYSAGSLFYSIKKQVEATGHMPSISYWPKGGTGAIAAGLADAIRENGGEIRTNTPVSRVIIQNGKVQGVEIEDRQHVVPLQVPDTRFIQAPVVASAVAIWDIFDIISEDDLSPWYAERLKYLHRKTLNLATITYALDKEGLWDHTGQRWVQKGPISGRPWMGSSLRYFEEMDRYQVSFWLQLGWWEKPDFFQIHKAAHKAALKQLFKDWESDIKILFPEVVENTLWTVRVFGPSTLIETPGNVGRKLIDIEAEGVDGLYLVGERTSAAKVMGVYGSAQTALKACDLILRKYPSVSSAAG